MMNYNDRAVGTRHRAGNHNRVIVGENLEHFEVEYAGGRIAHLSRHPHPFAHAARIRAVADRAAVAEVLVSAVRAREAGEMMALDNARVSVTLRHRGHIDLVADLEHVARRDWLAEGEIALAATLELARLDSRRDFRARKMSALAAGHPGQ